MVNTITLQPASSSDVKMCVCLCLFKLALWKITLDQSIQCNFYFLAVA